MEGTTKDHPSLEEPTPSLLLDRKLTKSMLIPRGSIDFARYTQKRTSQIILNPNRFRGSINAFDSSQKNNIINALQKKEKSQIDMNFLKKNFEDVVFFANFAIPMGNDVFESCINKMKIEHISIPKQGEEPFIKKGQKVNVLYVLISGGMVKSQESNFSSHKDKQDQTIRSIGKQIQSAFPQSFQILNLEKGSNNNIDCDSQKIIPVNSILESSFIQQSTSAFYFHVVEDSVFGSLSAQEFADSVEKSKNRELIKCINEIRASNFFKDWSVIPLKQIVNHSEEVSFQRSQEVYFQGQSPNNWYIVLSGEFEYEKRIEVDNEINEMTKIRLDRISHCFKKSTHFTDECKKQQICLRLSILQKGEIFGIEDLIPLKQGYSTTVKCISSQGVLRKVNENYLRKILQKKEEEAIKLNQLSELKADWLLKAVDDKLEMNKQFHSTILSNKRNLALKQTYLLDISPKFSNIQNLDKTNYQFSPINPHTPFKKFLKQEQKIIQSDSTPLVEDILPHLILRNQTRLSPIKQNLGYVMFENHKPFLEKETKINAKLQQNINNDDKELKEFESDLLSDYRLTLKKLPQEIKEKKLKRENKSMAGLETQKIPMFEGSFSTSISQNNIVISDNQKGSIFYKEENKLKTQQNHQIDDQLTQQKARNNLNNSSLPKFEKNYSIISEIQQTGIEIPIQVRRMISPLNIRDQTSFEKSPKKQFKVNKRLESIIQARNSMNKNMNVIIDPRVFEGIIKNKSLNRGRQSSMIHFNQSFMSNNNTIDFIPLGSQNNISKSTSPCTDFGQILSNYNFTTFTKFM